MRQTTIRGITWYEVTVDEKTASTYCKVTGLSVAWQWASTAFNSSDNSRWQYFGHGCYRFINLEDAVAFSLAWNTQ